MKIFRTSPEEELKRVSREAAEWLQAMKATPSEQERKAFLSWVGMSQLHLREVLLADMLDAELGRAGLLDGFDMEQVLADAALADNVVPLHGAGKVDFKPAVLAAMPVSGRHQRMRRMRRLGQVAAAVSFVFLGAAVWLFGISAVPSRQYASAIGEERVIGLADGSVVTLAPRSSIAVSFTPGERDIELQSGEADFKVAHDTSRPFRVQAGSSVIQAVGTRFSVNRLPSGTVVAVSEGKVRMMTQPVQALQQELKALLPWSDARDGQVLEAGVKPKSLGKPASLKAGEAVRIATNGRAYAGLNYLDLVGTRSPVPRLTFHEDTLADIVEQFNRYNARQIVVDDDAARWQRYSGVFNASDAESFLQFLECCSDLAVARDGEQTRIQAGMRR